MHEPLVTGDSPKIFRLWVRELRFTWFWILSISVVPCILYGSALFSLLALFVAFLIAAPVAAVGLL